MVISDRDKFAFVHIPKCAGTLLRQCLMEYDDYHNKFKNVKEHRTLGMLDYTHIPLVTLKEHFPIEFNKVKSYHSYAIVRDPYSRFSSSLSQRLKMYCVKSIHDINNYDIVAEINNVIAFLKVSSGRYNTLPPEFIHFQRQTDYLFIENEQIVDSIYKIDSLDKLIDNLNSRLSGMRIDRNAHMKNPNQSLVYKNSILRIFTESLKKKSKFFINKLSDQTKDKIRSVVYVSKDKKKIAAFNEPYVREFIEDYYREDIELIEKIV